MWISGAIARAGSGKWRTYQALRNIATGHSLHQTTSPAAQSPVYELRTYTLYPDKLREFLQLTEKEFHLRTVHSSPLGYWTTEIGGLNQVVHIWQYDSLKHRAGIRGNMAGDEAWLGGYVSKIVTMLQFQDNALFTLLPGTSISLPNGKGVYELQTLQLHGSPGVWSRPLVDYVQACGKACGSKSVMVGAWKSLLGPRQEAAILWQHQDPDGCVALDDKTHTLQESTSLTPHVTSGHSKLLLPHPVSPLQ